jgi:hypothetical protein
LALLVSLCLLVSDPDCRAADRLAQIPPSLESAIPLLELAPVLLAAQGKLKEALTAYQRSSEVLEAMTTDQRKNPVTRRDLGALYAKLGAADQMLATRTSQISEKVRLMSEARGWYQKGADVFLDLRNRNMLMPTEAGQPDKILTKVQESDKTLELLKSEPSK